MFRYFWNSFWLVITTMTTIGFGDIYPITNFGRILTIFACIWGFLVYALFVVSVNMVTKFNEDEHKAYDIMVKKEKYKSMNHKAKHAIVHFILFNYFRKKK